ncbi:MAG: WbqC family protein [Candidatus Melainabacteria bacterium]|nr:MAG: WbqC family protein [Candidatus Melainabacteria bacterium]
MSKLVSISQPAYLPWLGYFDRIAASDLHIVLDHVQLEKRSFTVRNKIRTPNGWNWLTVPVKTKGKGFDLPINQIEIQNEENWRKDHFQSIQNAYSKTAFYKEHSEFFDAFYFKEWHLLADLCQQQTEYLLGAFNINTPTLFSSSLNSQLFKDDLILDLCKKVECTTYISGPFGRDYLEEKKFVDAGIKIVYHDYSHPVYRQRWMPFEPNMSAIDLLFNCGPDSKKILSTTNLKEESMNVREG